jgi:hypothetical protein
MAFIRNQERMVYQTVYDHLKTQLTALDWLQTTVTSLPFGATVPVTLLQEVPDPKLGNLAPNTVAFTEGTSPDDEEGELGASYGGLWSTTHTFFIDVYGESIGIAKALTSDISAILKGRLSGTARTIPMVDQSLVPPADAVGHLLSFEDVEVNRPLAQGQLRWEVVKVTCVHQYNATVGLWL